MDKRIVVIGAIGLLGEPVARHYHALFRFGLDAFIHDGHFCLAGYRRRKAGTSGL